MKVAGILVLLIVIPAALGRSQDAVELNRQRFSGRWTFDVTKSDSNIRATYQGDTLEISYKEPEFQIVDTQTQKNETKSATVILFTDNRGEKNRPYPFNEDLEIESRTLWAKNTLVRTYAIKVYVSGRVAGSHAVRETYSLSEDGDSLTVIDESRTKISRDSPYGKLNTDDKGKLRRVYKRTK